MPPLNLVEVVDSTSKDDRCPPENIIKKFTNVNLKKWLSNKTDMNFSMQATFRLEKMSYISRFDIGNAGSATVTALVSRSGCKEFRELLPSTEIRSEAQCRRGENTTCVRMFSICDMRKETRHEKWDLLQVICCQPYRRSPDEQFGLSFVAVYGNFDTVSPTLSPRNSIEKFKEIAVRASLSGKKDIQNISSLSRADKMILASKSATSPEANHDDDLFKAMVMSVLESNKKQEWSVSDLRQYVESELGKTLSAFEKRRLMQLFREFASSKRSPGILTPRSNNRQIMTSPLSKRTQDAKSFLKPQFNDTYNALGRDSPQTVYRADVVHSHAIKDGSVTYMSPTGKENSPFGLKKCMVTDRTTEESAAKKPVSAEKKLCLDKQKNDKCSPRDSWKGDKDQCSPDSWLKRKSDPLERSQPVNKKRPREGTSIDSNNGDCPPVNRITPAGGWLLSNTGLAKPKDTLQFPFRVSPPPPPPLDRPLSPLPLVDDIDQPSTSSRETVAERNIRLELERKLAERSPPERVVQRTSSGKVKGTYCTKGMNTNDSPLRRLSICDEADEVDSPQARRKLTFAKQNGHQEEMVECPVCRAIFESPAINKHLDECVPTPTKRQDEGENDDEMACPICGMWQSKDTVAAHADECAQKRYGA